MICPGSFVRLLPGKNTGFGDSTWVWSDKTNKPPVDNEPGWFFLNKSEIDKKFYFVISIIVVDYSIKLKAYKNLIIKSHAGYVQPAGQPLACEVFSEIGQRLIDTCKICLLTDMGKIIWTDLSACENIF